VLRSLVALALLGAMLLATQPAAAIATHLTRAFTGEDLPLGPL